MTDDEKARFMNETWVKHQLAGTGDFILRHNGPRRLNKLANAALYATGAASLA